MSPPHLNDGLDVAIAMSVGLNMDSLKQVLEMADQDSHGDLKSLLVARYGRLVLEAYFNGTSRESLHDVRSVGKSFTAILIGTAIDDRMLNLETRVVDVFPDYFMRDNLDPSKKRIAVKHLLQMRSGLYADEDDPGTPGYEGSLERASDWLQFSLNIPMLAEPGEKWSYASANTVLLGGIVSRVAGRTLGEYAAEKLFSPLGISTYDWKKTPCGDVVPQGYLNLRSRDLLKFGIMIENQGSWSGKQLVSQEWIELSTRPNSTLDFPLYRSYGMHWWTGSERVGTKEISFFFASGNGGNKVFVVPDEKLVVIVTSTAYGLRRGHERSHNLLRGVLNSIKH